jgi:maltooligosyltrehalose trehalohydrolase
MDVWSLERGARLESAMRTGFRVWAPRARTVSVRWTRAGETREHALEADAGGVFAATVDGVGEGDEYVYRLDGERDRPDPVSR